jgi:hypothetical protein
VIDYRCGDPLDRALRMAATLFGRFHRYPPFAVERRRCPRLVPPVLVDLGELRALVYRSDKWQRGRPRSYIHFLECRPRLACDASGRQLYIVGGQYRVTPRGIEG